MGFCYLNQTQPQPPFYLERFRGIGEAAKRVATDPIFAVYSKIIDGLTFETQEAPKPQGVVESLSASFSNQSLINLFATHITVTARHFLLSKACGITSSFTAGAYPGSIVSAALQQGPIPGALIGGSLSTLNSYKTPISSKAIELYKTSKTDKVLSAFKWDAATGSIMLLAGGFSLLPELPSYLSYIPKPVTILSLTAFSLSATSFLKNAPLLLPSSSTPSSTSPWVQYCLFGSATLLTHATLPSLLQSPQSKLAACTIVSIADVAALIKGGS